MRFCVNTAKTPQMKNINDSKENGPYDLIDRVILEWLNRVNFRSELSPMEAEDYQKNDNHSEH